MRAALLLVAALGVALAGCAGSGPQEPYRYYVLDAPTPAAAPAAAAASAAPIDATLVVLPTVAVSFYATQEMAYSKADGVRAYYQFSSWTEPPDAAVTRMLLARIEAARIVRAVAVAGSNVRGTLVLATELREIYHDATSSPGTARIVVAAELRDPGKRAVVARRTFGADAPATSFDAAGAVQGCRVALATIGDAMTAWIAASAAR